MPTRCQTSSSRLSPPPRSTPFPYTTLFRSAPRSGPVRTRTPAARSARNPLPLTLGSEAEDFVHCGPRACPCGRSEEHTSELQSRVDIVCRLLLAKQKSDERGQDLPQPP